MSNVLGAKPVIDTTDFKSGLKQMNSELRVLDSSFKATAAGLTNWAKDATGLEARMKTLTGSIDIQRNKVALVRAEWERVKKEKGESSLAAKKLEADLNKEVGTLNKMELELGQTESALQELTDEEKAAGNAAQKMGKDVKDGSDKIETLKSVANGAVGILKGLVTAVAAVGAVAIGAVAGVATLTLKIAEQADALDDLSLVTNISKERLQELDFVGGILGTSLDTISSAQAKLTRAMSEGLDGTGKQAEAFEALGVSVTDASGNLRSTEAVFGDVLDALGGVENQAQRDALAMDLFGKSATELNPLIKAGADEIERLTEQAHEMGAVVSTETLDAYANLNDTLFAVKKGFQGVTAELLSAFLPGFQGVFDTAGGYLTEFKNIVTGSGGDFGKLAQGLTGLIAEIATDIASQAPAMLSAGLSIVQSLLDAITQSLPQLLDAGIAILTSLIDFIVQNLPTLIQAGVQILLTLVDALVKNLPMLVKAALQAVIALATGLADALPTLIPAIVEAVILIVQTLIENVPLLVEAATALILGLAEGLITALPILIAAIPELIGALIDALMTALPQLAEAAGELVGMLVYGILANIPVLLAAAGQLVAELLVLLVNLPKLVVEVGENLINGLVSGLDNAKNKLYDSITKLVDGIITKTKSILGISSPSSVFIGIAKDVVLGLINGLSSMVGSLTGTITGVFNGMISTARGYVGAFASVATDIVNGFINRFREKWASLTNVISGLFTGLIGWLKNLLGISSPSKVFGEIARFSVMGYEMAFMKAMKSLKAKAGAAFLELNAVAAGNGPQFTASGGNVQNDSFQFFAPVIVRGDTTPGSFGARLKTKRY